MIRTASHALSSLLVVYSLACVFGDGGNVMDRLPNCAQLVEKGECLSNAASMKQDCPLACRKWQEARQKVEYARVPENEPSFFELSAKTATGETINFSMFDGYLTIVANTLRSCVPGATEAALAAMEHLHTVWPYTLEILVFVFDTPENAEDMKQFEVTIGCDSHDMAVKKKGRRIHVMEQAELNGPSIHPVYQYLKKYFKLDDDKLPTDVATFFIVTPDGDRIEAHIGSTPDRIRQTISQHLEQDFSQDL